MSDVHYRRVFTPSISRQKRLDFNPNHTLVTQFSHLCQPHKKKPRFQIKLDVGNLMPRQFFPDSDKLFYSFLFFTESAQSLDIKESFQGEKYTQQIIFMAVYTLIKTCYFISASKSWNTGLINESIEGKCLFSGVANNSNCRDIWHKWPLICCFVRSHKHLFNINDLIL